MNLLRAKKLIGCSMLFFICTFLYSQEEQLTLKKLSPKEADTNWQKMLDLCPPTHVSSELKIIRTIPSSSSKSEDPYLWGPIKFEINQNGDLFVIDSDWGRILKYDAKGDLKATIGRRGQGPMEFQYPTGFSICDRQFVISDTGNYRIQFIDFDLNLTKSFRIFKAYIEIAAEKTGAHIYAAPINVIKTAPLVDVLDANGRLMNSIIEPRFNVNKGWNVANMVELALNKEGELLVAFKFFPLVCRYSSSGKLLAEWRIDNECLREKERNNLKWTSGSEDVAGLKPIIFSLRASDSGFFLLLNSPKTQVLEFDEHGVLRNDYWLALSNDFYATDFIVSSRLPREIYLLEKSPDPRVLVLRPKGPNYQ